MHLDLTLRDKTKARIEVPEGQSLEAALDAFLNRRGTYANGWVRAHLAGDERYIAYDEIVQVRAIA
jgi:hypothetical protein